MILEGTILVGCRQITSKRTTAAIYHIITGKKSVQTMQDIHIYDLQNYYGIHPSLSKDTFQRLIQQLKQQQFLVFDEQDCFQLTEKGQKWLSNLEQSGSLTGFAGLKYSRSGTAFSDRLLLIIQTISNSMRNHYRFIPIVDKKAVQVWVKSSYKMIKPRAENYRKQLYQELDRVLHTLPEQEANIFVDRLTGYKTYGKSSQQLANIYQLSLIDVPLVWTRIIHNILDIIQHHKEQYPVLHALIDDQSEQPFITATAKKTYQLLSRGYTIEKIALIRQLKVSTIYDHVVEIALVEPFFSITPFVNHEQYETIAQVIGQTTNYSLKQLKEKVDSGISYFQIRLVLATINKNKVKI